MEAPASSQQDSQNLPLKEHVDPKINEAAAAAADRLLAAKKAQNGDLNTEQKGLFGEINALRNERKEDPETDDTWPPVTDTICGRLAKNKRFEALTFFFIGMNSLYIGVDADYTARTGKPDSLYDKDMPVGFILMENVFCVYFTGEVVIRFIAYAHKLDSCRDGWFIFDGILVFMMVLETWIFPIFGLGGALSKFAVLRLLRLLRISRMARLMKKVPELMIIIKGMVASVRSVGCTAILQILVLYVFAIVFVSEYHEKEDVPQGEAEGIEDDFGNMRKAMFSLFIMGTVLDDVTYLTDSIRSTKNNFMLSVFIVFQIISSFTILNMLIGILCEVVSATAETEKQDMAANSVKEAISTLFLTLDQDQSGCISKDEFLKMRDDPDVKAALEDLEIEDMHFDRYCELLFNKDKQKKTDEDDGTPISISFETLINMILRLSPGNHINALDFSVLQASVDRSQEAIRERLKRIRENLNAAAGNLDRTTSTDSNAFQASIPKRLLEPEKRTPRQPVPVLDSAGSPDVKVAAPASDARAAALGDAPPLQPITPSAGASKDLRAAASGGTSGQPQEYTLDMFVSTSSHVIIEELERRLGVVASQSKTAQLGVDAQKNGQQPQAFHSLGVPEH